MHHRSHDREALDCSTEPGPSLGPGSSFSPDEARVRIHEAANWLAVLRGHVDLARERHGADPELLSAMQRALEGAERALRGGSGTEDTVDVGTLVREVAADARRLRPGLEIFVDAPPRGGLDARLDVQALRDVLLNLLKNAAEALEGLDGGTVRLIARPLESASFELVVEDDGPGMPAEVRERAFEPGFSTKDATDRGLGLARVAARLASLGATVDLHSRPGTGTRFRVVVPRGTSTAAGRSQAEEDLPARVLVVDDDPDVGAVLVEMMDALGVEAPRAITDPRQTVALCRSRAWDVVLLDRDLGTTRGDHLAIDVRQVDPAVAIVLLTGDPLIAAEAPRGALDMALAKPIGLDALRRRLQEAHALTVARRDPGPEAARHADR